MIKGDEHGQSLKLVPLKHLVVFCHENMSIYATMFVHTHHFMALIQLQIVIRFFNLLDVDIRPCSSNYCERLTTGRHFWQTELTLL